MGGHSSLLGLKHDIYSHTCDLKSNRDRRNSGNCNFKSHLYELLLGSNVGMHTWKCVCNQSTLTLMIHKVRYYSLKINLALPPTRILHLEGLKKHNNSFFFNSSCLLPQNFFLVSCNSLFSKKISVEKSDAPKTHLNSVGNPLFSYNLIKCYM